MKKKMLIAIVATFIFLSAVSVYSNQDDKEKIKEKYNQSEMIGIVVIAPNVTPSDIPYDVDTWNNKHYKKMLQIIGLDAKVARNSPQYAYAIVDVPAEQYNKTVEKLRKLGYFVRDELKGKLQLDESVQAMGGPYVWQDSLGAHRLTGAGSVITIIDTGIECNHTDFNDCSSDNSGKLLAWYDALDVSETPLDFLGHGTHVASIAAGTGAASYGRYTGVAPGAGLKVARACNLIGDCLERFVADAINWAVDNGTDVISMSIGYDEHIALDKCKGESVGPERDIYEAIKRANIVVASAGNLGVKNGSVSFPACIDKVIAVGATLKNNNEVYIDHDLPGWDGAAPINVTVKANDDTVYHVEWDSQPYEVTGIQIMVPHFPAEVKVMINAKWKYRCPIYYEGWDPGEGRFWEWTQTFTSGGPIGVEIAVRHIYEQWNWGICFQDYWNNTANTIDVRMFQSYDGLKDRVAIFSGNGPTPQGTEKPDVVAPGYNICAARASGISGESICGNNNYVAMSGTSMAAPHVAGLIALLKEAKNDISLSQIVSALKKADKHVFDVNVEGQGRVNVTRAIDYATNCEFKQTFDTDGDNPQTFGMCYQYGAWNGDSCPRTLFIDHCYGDYVYEYYASGSSCVSYQKNCKDYGSQYYCSYGACKYNYGYEGGGGGGGHYRK